MGNTANPHERRRSTHMTIVLLLLEAIDTIYTQQVTGFTLFGRLWKEAWGVCLSAAVSWRLVHIHFLPTIAGRPQVGSNSWHNTYRTPRTVRHAWQYMDALRVRGTTESATTLIWHPRHGKGHTSWSHHAACMHAFKKACCYCKDSLLAFRSNPKQYILRMTHP